MEAHLLSINNPGHVSPSAVTRMKALIPADTVMAVVSGMLHATRWVGIGEAAQEVPDWRTREAGVKIFLSYTEGLPVQRQEIITHDMGSGDLMARAEKSPALVRQIERMLELLKAKQAEK
jgi:hypothetical protein